MRCDGLGLGPLHCKAREGGGCTWGASWKRVASVDLDARCLCDRRPPTRPCWGGPQRCGDHAVANG